jgi:hypothetical protein
MSNIIDSINTPDRTSRAKATRREKARDAMVRLHEGMLNTFGPEVAEKNEMALIAEGQKNRSLSVGAIARRNRERLNNTIARKKKAQAKLTESLVAIVMDAAPLDEEAISVYGEKIANNTATFINTLFNEGVLTINAFSNNASATVRSLTAERLIGCNEQAADEAVVEVAEIVRKKTEKVITDEIKSADQLKKMKDSFTKDPNNPAGASAVGGNSDQPGLEATPDKGTPAPPEGDASTLDEALEADLDMISTDEKPVVLRESIKPVLLNNDKSKVTPGLEANAGDPIQHSSEDVAKSYKNAANTSETMGCQEHPGSSTNEEKKVSPIVSPVADCDKGTISNESAHLAGKPLGIKRTLHRQNPNSLYGKMFTRSLKRIAEENGGVLKEDSAEIAAGNAAVQYVILETLNTMRLIEGKEAIDRVTEMLLA